MPCAALQHAFGNIPAFPCRNHELEYHGIGKAPGVKASIMIFGYDYTHWLVIGSLALLTAAPVIGIAAGFIMSRLRRRRAAQ